MKGILALGLFAFAVGLAGCPTLQTRQPRDESAMMETAPVDDGMASSEKPQFPPVDSQQWTSTERGQTGVLFAWTIQGSRKLVSSSGCRLRVRHRESGDTVLLKIDSKAPISIQPLKPGTWDAKRLGCGLTRIWDLEGLFTDGFVVKSGSLSVIGWFVFEFDERTLKIVREGGREENTRLAAQLRSGWTGGSSLISGFSGKPIPAKLDARDETVRVKASGLRNSDELLRPLLTRFQSCASQAMKVDPLRAGLLKMEVSYRGGRYAGVKTGLGEHALRDDLIQCILQAHETYQVAGGGDFTLETTY